VHVKGAHDACDIGFAVDVVAGGASTFGTTSTVRVVERTRAGTLAGDFELLVRSPAPPTR
jgi:hypothetical protein